MADLDFIRQDIQKRLKHGRFQHTLSVEKMAAHFANHIGYSELKARTAALLHDIGKSMDMENQINYAGEHNIFLSPDDLRANGIIHAKIGAHIARKDYGIEDHEVLNAVISHTTGSSDMSMLNKILYVADYLDPQRDLHSHKYLLRLTEDDFEMGVFEIHKEKIHYVLEKNDYLHPESVLFYNVQLELILEREKTDLHE